jgi:GT2 family glycosyltransferase
MAEVEKAGEGARPAVSAIVCTYNRAGRLERALRALGRQTPPPGGMEIVVVDDGSTDETPQVCERLAGEMANLRYVSVGANRGLSRARNKGAAEARGEFLLYTDDDCIPEPDWAVRMAQSLQEEPVMAGAVATTYGDYVQLCHNIAQVYGFMPCQRAGPVALLAGANMGFWRGALEEVGGFREDLRYAEDMDFALRARAHGYRPYFNPDAVVTHEPGRTTLRAVFAYAMTHAASTIHLRNAYRSTMGTPFVLRSPVLLLCAAPVIALAATLRIYLSSAALARRFATAPVVYALKVAWCVGAARGLRHPPAELRTA